MENVDVYQKVLEELPERFEGKSFLSVADITNYLEIAPRTVHGLIERGELPAFKVGKEYRIPFDGFRRYLRASASVHSETQE